MNKHGWRLHRWILTTVRAWSGSAAEGPWRWRRSVAGSSWSSWGRRASRSLRTDTRTWNRPLAGWDTSRRSYTRRRRSGRSVTRSHTAHLTDRRKEFSLVFEHTNTFYCSCGSQLHFIEESTLSRMFLLNQTQWENGRISKDHLFRLRSLTFDWDLSTVWDVVEISSQTRRHTRVVFSDETSETLQISISSPGETIETIL